MFPFAKNLIPHLVVNLHKLSARAERKASSSRGLEKIMKCYVYLRDKNETKICVMFPFTNNLSLTWLQTYINFAQKLFYREKSKQ